ncbi:hypothetical protein LTR66_001347 [Elasticomyces elasticus]|nr:hypothetical protein LTR66_001347 [Elasticomyces elasticus]
MSTSDGTETPFKQKFFVPLENNPEVFGTLARHLGVAEELGFYDVYSLDDPDLLSHIPRPVYALIFICPSVVYYAARREENDHMAEYASHGETEPVFWVKQTIGNACGLYGLLHAISNGPARKHILPGSELESLLKEAILLEPKARADIIYHSQALEEAHQKAAVLGDTEAPPAEEEPDGHFICFVKGDDGRLWELNGGMKGPVDRGTLAPEMDALSEEAIQLGVGDFLSVAKEAGIEDVAFSIVAVAPKHGE